MIKGIVFDIRKYSIHDGPGIRTTVFFKGCSLSCMWCHNPESQALEPELMLRENRCIRCMACLAACARGAIWQDQDKIVTSPELCTQCGACAEVCLAEAREMAGREMSVPQVMAEIERDVAFYDESGGGVTCSGGEPLMQPDFLRALLCACREREIHTALDTSGFAPWAVIDSLRACVNLFLYDLKLVDDARHRQFVGVSNALILQNARALAARGHQLVLRIPIIPGINDDDDSVCQMGAFARELACLNGIDLLPYHHIGAEKYARMHKPYALPDTRPPSAERMEAIEKILHGFGARVKIG